MIRAILFDMDGTLVNTEPFYYKRKVNYLISKGLPHDEQLLQAYTGRMMKDLFAHIFEGNEDLITKHTQGYMEYIKEQPTDYASFLYPEVIEVLQYLKSQGYQLGLVSASMRENVYLMIEQCHLKSYFDVVITGSDVPKAKPDPQVYVEAMHQLGLQPSQCMVVEDSISGIQAGVLAGCKVINRRHEDQEYPKHLVIHTVDDLRELKALLTGMMR